jgi:hypothetical protein
MPSAGGFTTGRGFSPSVSQLSEAANERAANRGWGSARPDRRGTRRSVRRRRSIRGPGLRGASRPGTATGPDGPGPDPPRHGADRRGGWPCPGPSRPASAPRTRDGLCRTPGMHLRPTAWRRPRTPNYWAPAPGWTQAPGHYPHPAMPATHAAGAYPDPGHPGAVVGLCGGRSGEPASPPEGGDHRRRGPGLHAARRGRRRAGDHHGGPRSRPVPQPHGRLSPDQRERAAHGDQGGCEGLGLCPGRAGGG